MTSLGVSSLLDVWEAGAAESPALRALLMLCAAFPGQAPESLAAMAVGQRDAQLLALRERLFGPDIVGIARCPSCDEAIELKFSVRDIRVAHAHPGTSFCVEAEGREIRFRVVNGADLIALHGQSDPAAAGRLLLARCVLEGALPDELPDSWQALAARRMAEADPQAEVLLDLACPRCGQSSQAPFEIENYLWTELDRWARERLHDVHAIAQTYGWSEADILAMSATRRRTYLDLIAA
jgi:hypothetical protein